MTVQNAAAEAARRAAEEAARRAREEAARKAREAAAKKAQEAAAKRNAEAAAKQAEAHKRSEPAKLEADRKTGALAKLDAGDRSPGADPAAAKQAEADRKALKAVRSDLKRVETPEDLQKLAERAHKLDAGIQADPTQPPGVRSEAERLSKSVDAASQAVGAIRENREGMHGAPEQKAATAARLLANGAAFEQALGGLQALKGSPLAGKAVGDLKALSEAARPERVTEALSKNPDLSAYPAGFAADAARLRGLGDPALDKALDGAAKAALDQPGGLTLERVKADPGLAQLVAGSADPAVKERAGAAAKGWAKEILDRQLDGKEGKDGVKEAMDGLKGELTDLAQKTGMGEALGAGAQAAVEEDKGRIEDVSKKGGGIFGAIKNALGGLGDMVGNLASDLIKISPVNLAGEGLKKIGLGGVVTGVQQVADSAVGGFGDIMKKGFGALGNVADFAMDMSGKVVGKGLMGGLGKGLEAVGLDGAGHALEKGGDLYAKGMDFAGDQVGNFTKGFGDALSGTVTGLGQMAVHPVQTMQSMAFLATHPGQLKEVGKALWKDGTKHGVAGAIGYVAGNLAPMLLTGGGAAGTLIGTGSRMAEAAGAASRFGTAMRVTGKALELGGRGIQVGAKGMQITKELTSLQFGKAIQTAGTPASKLMRANTAAANAAFSTQIRTMRGGMKAIFKKDERIALHEAGEKRMLSDLTGSQRAAREAADPGRLFKTKEERLAYSTSNRAEAKRLAEARGRGMAPAPLKAQLKMLKRKREAFNREMDRATNPGEAARVRMQRDADTAKRVHKVFDTLRTKPGYRASEAALKLGAQSYKAVSSPLSFLTKKADNQLARFLRKDIYDSLKASGTTLTPKRQAVHTAFGLFSAHVTQAAPYKAEEKKKEEWLLGALRPESENAKLDAEHFRNFVAERYDWAPPAPAPLAVR